MKVLDSQSCWTLCDPMGCSPPGSSVHGILQERILEWVAMPSSKGSSQPRDQTPVSSTAGRFFTESPTSILGFIGKVLGRKRIYTVFWLLHDNTQCQKENSSSSESPRRPLTIPISWSSHLCVVHSLSLTKLVIVTNRTWQMWWCVSSKVRWQKALQLAP